jgi:hypothetical protein
MHIALAMTPNDKPVASSSHDPNGPRGAVEQATKIEAQVDLMAEIPEAPAEQPAEQLVLQLSALLQHQTPTKQDLTSAQSGPITELVIENSDDKLEHLCRVAEHIQKQCEIKELRRLIAGKTTQARSESLDALTKSQPPKRVVAEFSTLPIQRATVYPSPYSDGC